MDILFCSRGRGNGHAVRDIAIASTLRLLMPEIELAFASYDAGYSKLQTCEDHVFDLLLPEKNSFPELLVGYARIVNKHRPTLVVAQEDMAALAASAIFNVRSCFTTHWFPKEPRGNHQALAYASRVLFMENAGIFPEPLQVRDRVTYCGPLIRQLHLDDVEKVAMRHTLRLGDDDDLILVLPGSPPEAREPIFDLVTCAFSHLHGRKRLVWIAGRDYDEISARASSLQNTLVLRYLANTENLILLSRVVITRGTYNLTKEVSALGRPCVTLTHGFNWVDDVFASRDRNNTVVDASKASPDELAGVLARSIQLKITAEPDPTSLSNQGAMRVASELLLELDHARRA